MENQPLIPHPDCPPPPGVAVSVAWKMPQAHVLTLEYRVADPTGAILWPAPADGRADNLWQHSCFEAFIGSTNNPATSASYAEFNLAPSGGWAAYAFDGYRSGMRNLDIATPPVITGSAPGVWTAALDLGGIDALIGPAPWRLALTAVIKAKDGTKSFWSLAHPQGKPDFHHADCFAARIS